MGGGSECLVALWGGRSESNIPSLSFSPVHVCRSGGSSPPLLEGSFSFTTPAALLPPSGLLPTPPGPAPSPHPGCLSLACPAGPGPPPRPSNPHASEAYHGCSVLHVPLCPLPLPGPHPFQKLWGVGGRGIMNPWGGGGLGELSPCFLLLLRTCHFCVWTLICLRNSRVLLISLIYLPSLPQRPSSIPSDPRFLSPWCPSPPFSLFLPHPPFLHAHSYVTQPPAALSPPWARRLENTRTDTQGVKAAPFP